MDKRVKTNKKAKDLVPLAFAPRRLPTHNICRVPRQFILRLFNGPVMRYKVAKSKES